MFSLVSLLEFYLNINFNYIFGTGFYRLILFQELHKMDKPVRNSSYIVSVNNIDLNFSRSFTVCALFMSFLFNI